MTIEIPDGGWAWDSVETILRRRGHVVATTGDDGKTLWPSSREYVEASNAFIAEHGGLRHRDVFGPSPLRRYVDFFGRGGFRKMLRSLVAAPNHIGQSAMLASVAGKRYDDYMDFLEALQVVDRIDGKVRLLRSLPDLGPSLEHYVAQLFMYDLHGHALWGVNLEGIDSGDFDVIAWLPPNLVYLETKSGAPSAIDKAELRQVLHRTSALAPDLTIVVVDTDTDLAPVAAKLESALLAALNSGVSDYFLPPRPQPDFGGISVGVHQHWPVYVAGAKPSVLAQLRWCLRHYHSVAKWR